MIGGEHVSGRAPTCWLYLWSAIDGA